MGSMIEALHGFGAEEFASLVGFPSQEGGRAGAASRRRRIHGTEALRIRRTRATMDFEDGPTSLPDRDTWKQVPTRRSDP